MHYGDQAYVRTSDNVTSRSIFIVRMIVKRTNLAGFICSWSHFHGSFENVIFSWLYVRFSYTISNMLTIVGVWNYYNVHMSVWQVKRVSDLNLFFIVHWTMLFSWLYISFLDTLSNMLTIVGR